MPGVAKVAVSFKDKTAVVTYDDSKTDVKGLTSATTNAGYPLRPKVKRDDLRVVTLVRTAPQRSWRRCQPTLVSFSMIAKAAERRCVRSRAIAACFVPSAQCRVHLCSVSAPASRKTFLAVV